MTPKTKKTIFFSLVGIIAIGGAIGYYLYNKGPVDVKNTNGKKVISTALYQSFSKDSAQAKNDFSNKILEVTGIVERISQNQQNQAIVLLKTSDAGAYINCTMEGLSTDIKELDAVIIKGICTGMGMGEPDLGILGDVYLIRCYLVK